jgi:hypothetical protein
MNSKENQVESSYTKYLNMGVVGLLFLCFGVVTLAQASVTGDKLYPVKIQVIEPIIKYVHFTPTAKANYEASLAFERTQELQKLQDKGRLTKELSEENQELFNKNIEAVNRARGEIDNLNILVNLDSVISTRIGILNPVQVQE